ncbi:hypothetical protein, variant [Phialophora macrospora]|nr:hypothetical protein, variant [Phialophora macrospora]
MTRVIVSGTVASIFVGMSGASLGALIFDTATIPFIASASAGFLLGVWGFYRDAVRKSLRAVDRFPQLLQLHLDGNFPHRGFDTWEMSRFRSATFGKSWVLQSMLIASWMTANRAIERIYEAEEERILLSFTAGAEALEPSVEKA